MSKVMVFRHTGSMYKSPASDKIVRNGKVFHVLEDGVSEVESCHTHRSLHTNKNFKFKELRNE